MRYRAGARSFPIYENRLRHRQRASRCRIRPVCDRRQSGQWLSSV